MTRLTISVTGNPLTFRPVTSSVVRKSKDGDVNVVILLFGTHYNISMNGILQQDSTGDINTSTQSIGVDGGLVELSCQQRTAAVTTANLVGTFSSFMYFYPGLVIKGHLKLSESLHTVPVPEFEGHYHFTDLLSEDALVFRLVRKRRFVVFEMAEVVDGVDRVVYTEDLDVGVSEKHFKFDFLVNGKSKLFTFVDYGLAAQAQTRVWIGDLRARIGECNVSIHNHNADQDLKTVSSDFIFLEYPQVFLKFDRTPTDRFVSPVTMYDDLNDGVEANWRQVRSRDYKFVGNRILENGMLRIVIRTIDPVIEFWGWNFNARFPSWEKAFSLIVDSDNGSQSLQVQNITFDYFTKMQLKATVNFGTSLYSFVMTRGDPYLTVLNKGKLKLRIKTSKNRMGADFGEVSNNYSLVNTFENGNPSSNAVAASSSVIVSEGGGSYFIDVNGLRYTAFNGPNSGVGYFNTSTVVDGESGGLVPFDIHLSAQGVTGYNDRLYVIDHNTAIIIYDTNGVNHGSFALDSDNSNPQGLTLFREKFYVSNSSGTRKLFGYNLDGTRNSSLDISLTWAIIALASTADRLYILRSNARVYVYREDKTLDFSFNLNLGLSSNAAQGMTIFNDKLYVSELVNNKIHVFSLTGVRDQSLEIDLVSENTFARGMANLNGVLWVVDSPAAKAFPYYIKATPEVIASRLAVAVNSDSRLGVDVPSHDVNATVNGAVVRLSSGEVGSLGNNIRIDVSNTDNKVYALSNSLEGGAQGDQSETLSAFTLNDNYFGFYNNNVNNEIVGWMSNMVSPVSIDVENVEGGMMYGFVYPVKGNVFGLGILPSYPTNLVGVVPFPFVVGNQDEYIKWRANEALLAFRQLETFKRR